jgi:hypothetical protein
MEPEHGIGGASLRYVVTVMHDFDRSPDQIRLSVEASHSGGTPDEVFTLELRMGEEAVDEGKGRLIFVPLHLR